MKQRTFAEFKRALLWTINIGTGEIGRQQVGRELQAVKIAFDAVGKHLDCAGLGEPRRTFHEQVAVAKQRDQHPVDQVGLTDNQPTRVCFEFLKLFCDAH